MLPQEEFFEINIDDNGTAVLYRVDIELYNEDKYKFEHVYQTEKGDTYPLINDTISGDNILVVDEKHLYELLDDMIARGFCDNVNFDFVLPL